MDFAKTKGACVNRHPAIIGVAAIEGRQVDPGRSAGVLLFLILCGLLYSSTFAAAQGTGWAILITGVSGDPELQQTYLKEMADLHSILENSLGFPRDHIVVLFDDPSKDPSLIGHKATREELQNVCRDLARRAQKADFVFVFIEGHGDFDGKIYKLNLVGPDPNGEELAAMLYSIPAQRFVIVNATNCSGGSIPAFSQKGTIVITATKSGMEKNQTHAGRYFIEALRNGAADSDKNGRVSMLEAFAFTRQKIEDYFKGEGNLQTEHPVLDDNGDGTSQDNPAPGNGEGLLARTTFLDAVNPQTAGLSLTPEQQKLKQEAIDLEAKIEELKYAKEKMPEAEYELKLEGLLLKLAKINAKLPR
jgi:hypothetical protein